MARHGIFTSEAPTSVSTPVVAQSAIPFVIGKAPIQSAEAGAPVGAPVLCTSWSEAVKKLGYSEDWRKYGLSEFMFSHFQLYNCQPVIFCNLLDTATMKAAVPAGDMPVTDYKIKLPLEAIDDDTLVIKAAGGTGTGYEKDTDYAVIYSAESCIIEVLDGGVIYTATSLNIAYSTVDVTAVDGSAVALGMEAIEQCMSQLGIIPDIICAPGFLHDTTVAAVMAAKGAGINGLFTAKPLIDISTDSTDGADEYSKVIALKNSNNFVDLNQILCWPMLALGDRKFHMSTQLAGVMASVDTLNNGVPYESPSNKSFKCDSLILADGTPVRQTKAQADILNNGGIVTGLGFNGGIVAWGNYTACYPVNTDVKDYFISVSRMFDWIAKSETLTYWGRIDKPMNRRLVGSILDSINIWLNGLVGAGYLLGARAELIAEENPLTDLMAGIIRIHNYITPPSPMQECEFILEYSADYVSAAFQ